MQMKIFSPVILLQKYTIAFFLLIIGVTTVTAQVSITCPPDIVMSNDEGECGAIVNYIPPIGTGSGTNITTQLVSGLPPGAYFGAGTTQIVYEVTNDEGDSEQCSFYITVNDTESPVFDCPTTNYIFYADEGTCSTIANFDIPDVTDNCQLFAVFQFGGSPSGSDFTVGEHFLDFMASDLEGNQAFCRVILQVIDTTDPEITCPEDITVSASANCDAVVNYTPPVGTDDCTTATTTLISGIGPGGTFPIGTTTETYQVTDEDGNTATCSFNIHVIDDTPPVITCPIDQVVNLDPGECEAEINFSFPTATDNCPDVTIAQTGGLPSGSMFPAGKHTIEFTATDNAGNEAKCSYSYFVVENIDPEIVCADDIVVDNDPGECGAYVTVPEPIGSDNCGVFTIQLVSGIPSGDFFPLGTTINTYVIQDPSENTAVCNVTITVNDTQAPVIDCQDIVVSTEPGTCEATVTFNDPDVTDNCGINSFAQTDGPASGSTFPIGNTTIEYTATDNAGNTTICTFDIIVKDEEAPQITCPTDISFTIPNDECTTIITYPAPTISDNCGTVTWEVESGPESGDQVNAGNYTVILKASDEAGNSTTCSFEIEILETSKPVFDCPNDIYYPTTLNNDCEGVVIFDAPTATDDCSNVTVVQTAGLASGSLFPAGVNTVEFTATDDFGNTETCSFDIVVISEEDLIINCPQNIEVNTEPGVCEAVVHYDAPTTNDNCAITTVTHIAGPVSGSTFPTGETTITYQISDLAGNTETCSFTITVIDEEVPEITCPADIVLTIADGLCEDVVNYALPTATDNCAIQDIELVSGMDSGELFPVGTTTVEYKATDIFGNTAKCSFSVTLKENIPPTIDCPADIIINNDPGICGAIVTYTPPVGDDNCDGAITERIAGMEPGSEFPTGTTTITYKVTDVSGNETTCSFDITVLDAENPIFNCPDDITLNSDDNQCGTEYTFSLPDVTDNCTANPVVTQTQGPPSGSVLPLGETVFEFQAVDEVGNTETCSYTVTVQDITPPIFTDCPSDSVIYLTPNSCTATVHYGNPHAYDNCNVTISQTGGPSNGAALTPGEYVYELTAQDNAGNTAICTFTYTIIDTIAPVITCVESFETCDIYPEFSIPTATDNCGIDTIFQISGPTSGSLFPEGETEIKFVALDLSANADTCSFTITVLKSAPEPFAGSDILLCDESTTTLSGSDPEDAAVTWTYISGGDVTIENPTAQETKVTGLDAGNHLFVYSLDPLTGCEVKHDTLEVVVENGVSVDAGPPLLMMYGSSINLSANPTPAGGSFEWSPGDYLSCTGCENPAASPPITTTFEVTYASELGCTATDSVLVRVFREIPNTITPDGDGVNDVWNIPEIEKYPQAHVVIYNRWGNLVFESTGYREPWDGTHRGKELPAGSYFYIIDFKSQSRETLNGTVNIIR